MSNRFLLTVALVLPLAFAGGCTKRTTTTATVNETTTTSVEGDEAFKKSDEKTTQQMGEAHQGTVVLGDEALGK